MRRQRRGASALEFALSVTVLLTLMVGIINWAWYLYLLVTLQTAAWEGARLGAGVSTSGFPTTVAEDRVNEVVAAQGLDQYLVVTVHGTLAQQMSGPELVVDLTAPFTPPLDFFPMPNQLSVSVATSWYGT